MSMDSIRRAYILQPGQLIGSYKVVRPLGAGGMGEVYLVEHQHLRKSYALKILPADLSEDGMFIDRFRIEARVMADLEHPNIVRVHNFGEEQGKHYLVMDYVEGPDGSPRTLEDDLAWGKKLPQALVKGVAIQLCDALVYAHGFRGDGVVHRDLKPSNILLQRGEERDSHAGAVPRIKIADFGLAKIVGGEYIRNVLDRSASLTMAGPSKPKGSEDATEAAAPGSSTVSLLGTYDYMSPEQKTGAVIDARSDLFSFGVILYRMLTGHKPDGAYEPPSRSGAHKDWDNVIKKCLQRDVDRRYQSAAALLKDLQAVCTPAHLKANVRYAALGAGGLTLLLLGLFLRDGKEETVVPDALPTPTVEAVATATPAPTATPLPEPTPTPLPTATPVPTPTPVPVAVLPTAVPPTPTPLPTRIPPTPTPTKIPVGPDGLPLEVFSVNVQPAGATVRILRDGVVTMVQTNEQAGPLRFPLAHGLYTIKAEKMGYRAQQRDVVVGLVEKSIKMTLEDAYGLVRVTNPQQATITVLGPDGRARPATDAVSIGGLATYNLREGDYKFIFAHPDFQAKTQVVEVREARPMDLDGTLSGLPGRIRVRSPEPLEVWHLGKKLGASDGWISQVPPGTYDLDLRRPGYRGAKTSLVLAPNGETDVEVPALVRETATLSIRSTVQQKGKGSEYKGPAILVLGTDGKEEAITLPHERTLHEMGKPIKVTVTAPGYAAASTHTITPKDYDKLVLDTKLAPKPSMVTVNSAVPAQIYEEDSVEGLYLRRSILRAEKPIGKTGEPLKLEPFVVHRFWVHAEGHVPVKVQFEFDQPDTTYPATEVVLAPLPPAILDVTTDPPDAEIWIDGKLADSPKVAIPPRTKVNIEVRRDGYSPRRDTFSGESGQTTPKTYRLQKIP